MQNLDDAKQVIQATWPQIKQECLSVLGSELHYQAMIYHLPPSDRLALISARSAKETT